MREIFIVCEHRMGEIRDVTFEMLSKARELAESIEATPTAVLLGYETKEFAKKLSSEAEKVLIVEDAKLKEFNSETYQRVLSSLINQYKPILTMIGHTAFGMDLAPSLAVELNVPLATDCIDLEFKNGRLFVTRQIYGGKVNVRAVLKESESYMVTVRPAAFEAKEAKLKGEIIQIPSPLTEEIEYKKFVKYIEPPVGEVDITSADVIVSIGRGIKGKENIPIAEELAKALGGVLACSRPIVDKGWLPKDRQVGTSGKTVKPKLYIALGISGAFQHVTGIKGSGIIIAVNKDPKAPIFRVADYGIVEDMFKVIPVLKNKIMELKG